MTTTTPTQYDHLSHEGFYAGLRYCGSKDGTSCHLPYIRMAEQEAWADAHIRCEECRKILAEAKDG